jgi:hypothetical protein
MNNPNKRANNYSTPRTIVLDSNDVETKNYETNKNLYLNNVRGNTTKNATVSTVTGGQMVIMRELIIWKRECPNDILN